MQSPPSSPLKLKVGRRLARRVVVSEDEPEYVVNVKSDDGVAMVSTSQYVDVNVSDDLRHFNSPFSTTPLANPATLPTLSTPLTLPPVPPLLINHLACSPTPLHTMMTW
jgi:hypothetical protein